MLIQPNQIFTHAYFIESGLGSVVTSTPEGLKAESGMFGRDGFMPTGLALSDDRSLYRTLIQVAGDGYQIEAEVLR